jgi:hypothetical protein
MNERWHERHPMPKNPTLAQRVSWHTVHAEQCGCRPMPKTVVDALRARSIANPAPANAPGKRTAR